MGDDSIDTVISHIDMGYLVTLQPGPPYRDAGEVSPQIDDGRPSLVLI